MLVRVRSLTARVLLFSSIWAVIALVAIALVISTLYRTSSERGFGILLRAQLNSVINAVTMDDAGRLAGRPELGELTFSQPDSGWYWIVDPLNEEGGKRLASISLGNADLPVPPVSDVPFDTRYVREYTVMDHAGNHIEVVETEVDLGSGAARFRVTGNRNVLEADISAFSNRLYIALALFGLGSLIINSLAILFGLRPLERVRQALGRIRTGKETGLSGDFPREIAPLATEINALIETNSRLVERARMQVGNLAHSLKTPIAVLINESRDMEERHGQLVRSQAETMQAQVQTYLNRARIAAQRGSVLARTEVRPALERMLRVMRKLNPDVEFAVSIESADAVLAMEQQDFEEVLGNLLENAARFARNRIEIRVAPASADAVAAGTAVEGARNWIMVLIGDDGPGLDEAQMSEAMKRGRRLDESRPGTGLGLSIVSEIVSEYRGVFTLSRSPAGGLEARLVLPAPLAET